jgi:hypothetical protein
MGANKSIKVIFKAYDQTHELIFPATHQLSDVSNYLRNVCHTYVILDLIPTSKEPTI